MQWPSPTRALLRSHTPVPAECHGLDPASAAAILAAVETQYLGARARSSARRRFREKLHVDDLLLARACAAGVESAWEELWRRYQARLRRAALALTHEPTRARELADGLLAELFGMHTHNGERVCKLNSFTGIGSLEGWLCALLARSHVDAWRRERRLVGLETEAGLEAVSALHACLAPSPLAHPPQASTAPGPVAAALETVLAQVDETARLILSLYFLDGKTLAEIGALLQVHESTVSRRLERILARLRRQTGQELRRRGLAPALLDDPAQTDPRWLQVDVRKALGVGTPVATPGSGSTHGV